jgi:hypothetical protein
LVAASGERKSIELPAAPVLDGNVVRVLRQFIGQSL